MFDRLRYPFGDIGFDTAMMSCLAYVVGAARWTGLYDAYAQDLPFARFSRAMLRFVRP